MAVVRSLTLMLAITSLAVPALAGPVSLLPDPTDNDGRVTLGELFDGAGEASGVVVGQRTGAAAVFEASQIQAAARRAGLQWSNPQGLRRIVVREGGALPAEASARPTVASIASRPAATVEVLTYARSLAAGDIIQPADVVWSSVQSHQVVVGGPQDADQVVGLSARRALRAGAAVTSRDLASPQVIARNDMVQVSYIVGGVELTVTGKAVRDASAGEAVPVLNIQSGRTIDAVAISPGRAVAGPAAAAARTYPQQFAAR